MWEELIEKGRNLFRQVFFQQVVGIVKELGFKSVIQGLLAEIARLYNAGKKSSDGEGL